MLWKHLVKWNISNQRFKQRSNSPIERFALSRGRIMEEKIMFVRTKYDIYDTEYFFEDSEGNYLNQDLDIVIRVEDIEKRSDDLQNLFDAFIIYNEYDGYYRVTDYKETKYMKCEDLDEYYFKNPPMSDEHTLYGCIFIFEHDSLGKPIFNIKTVTIGRKKYEKFSLLK